MRGAFTLLVILSSQSYGEHGSLRKMSSVIQWFRAFDDLLHDLLEGACSYSLHASILPAIQNDPLRRDVGVITTRFSYLARVLLKNVLGINLLLSLCCYQQARRSCLNSSTDPSLWWSTVQMMIVFVNCACVRFRKKREEEVRLAYISKKFNVTFCSCFAVLSATSNVTLVK